MADDENSADKISILFYWNSPGFDYLDRLDNDFRPAALPGEVSSLCARFEGKPNCETTFPEPATMVLLGTGLAGIAAKV